MKVLTIVGARPQFIKAAVVSNAIARHNESSQSYIIDEIIVHTGQHYDSNMSESFFEQLEIKPPRYNLHVNGISNSAMTGRMLEKIDEVITIESPDMVLVYGDTNSTLAGALAGIKNHIPVAHVEAGLRSNNMYMQEEINRITTDRVSSILFAPTKRSIDNLVDEGYPWPTISNKRQCLEFVGDVMYDLALKINTDGDFLFKLGLENKNYVLVTIHRQENVDDKIRLESILLQLNELSKDFVLVFPMHPRTRKVIDEHQLTKYLDGIVVVEPLPYLETQSLIAHARSVITDSGGVQKEAFFHKTPCVTLRDETEWPETLVNGCNQLSDIHKDSIVELIKLGDGVKFDCVGDFGDGTAGEKIVACIVNYVYKT